MADEINRGTLRLITILLIALVALLVAIGAGGAYLSTQMLEQMANLSAGESSEESTSQEPRAPAQYVAFEDAITVNLQESEEGRAAVLQARVEVMARSEETVEAINTHMPAIRDNLIMLYSAMTREQAISPEGKERMRAQSLEAINQVLTDEGFDGQPAEAIFFSSFVTQ